MMALFRTSSKAYCWILRCSAFSLMCAASLEAFSAPPPKKSDEAIAAEILFKEANQLVEKGQCAEAIPKFEASERADHSKGTLYNLANAYECAGRLATAWKTFMTIVNEPVSGTTSSIQADAEKRADALEPRLPKLTIVVPETLAKTAKLEVLVDDEPLPSSLWNVPAPVDPGVRKVTVNAPGKTSWSSQTRELKEKDTERVEVPDSLVSTPFPKQRIVALSVGGAGLAIGIAASVVGIIALSKSAEADKSCADKAKELSISGREPCLYAGAPEVFNSGAQAMKHDAHNVGLVSTTLFIVSTAALGTAAILWFTTSSPKKDTAVQFLPYAAPGNVGATLHVTF